MYILVNSALDGTIDFQQLTLHSQSRRLFLWHCSVVDRFQSSSLHKYEKPTFSNEICNNVKWKT